MCDTLRDAVKEWINAPHIVHFGDTGWTLRHPLSCDLEGCEVQRLVEDYTDDGVADDERGYWTCGVNLDGFLSLYDRLGIEPPNDPRKAVREAFAALNPKETPDA